MKKRILQLLILLFITTAACAQTWKWAKVGGGSLNDLATDQLVDDEDNMYACGTYTNQASFDGQTITASVKIAF